MPSVRERFVTYHDFAKSNLQEIYGERLKDAKKFEVTTLASAFFINQGTPTEPRFVFQEMPKLAQLAPVFGMSISDFDADGNIDVILAQNFYHPQRETGRWNGGLGVLLKGRGDGEFDAEWPASSGIKIPEDTKSLVICDSNNDQRPDFIAGINNGPLQLWTYQETDASFMSIRLVGKNGNLAAAGAKVITEGTDGRELIYEIQSGSGYLSQAAPQLFLRRAGMSSIRVVWADGTESVVPDFLDAKIVFKQ